MSRSVSTPAAIRKFEPKLLANFRDTYMVPNNATLILIGKLPARDSVVLTVAIGVTMFAAAERLSAAIASAPMPDGVGLNTFSSQAVAISLFAVWLWVKSLPHILPVLATLIYLGRAGHELERAVSRVG